MTRRELARFWDEQLARWFRGQAFAPALERWQLAYDGEVQEWAFPEPFIGDLLGSPRIVLLANNPGVAHEELQTRTGVFAPEITEQGFTAWAATRPYEGADSEWEKRYGPIAHNRHRLDFARRFLGDQTVRFDDLLNVELYPWHSLRLTHAIRVQPQTLREFVLEPVSDLGSEVPVVALGRAWADALDRVPELIARCEEFGGFRVRSRRARLYTIRDGSRLLVAWHVGSDKPPAADDTALLREVWFGGSDGACLEARVVKESTSVRPRHQNPLAQRRLISGRRSTRSAARPRFTSTDELATSVRDETIRSLIHSLPQWIADEFQGDAGAVLRPTGQFRLRALGEPTGIGWDFKQRWAWVWVNRPLPGDRAALSSSLSDPRIGNLRPAGLSFRIHNDPDADALRALIQRHVNAARRAAGVAR